MPTIKRGGYELVDIIRQGYPLLKVFRSGYLVWDKTKEDIDDESMSCFGNGYWVDTLPWLDSDAWRDNN